MKVAALASLSLMLGLAHCGGGGGGTTNPPPDTTGGGGQTANAECATPQPGWIWCDDFETNRFNKYFEYDSAAGNFTRVAGVGHNGSFGMRAHFTAGAVSVGALHLAFGRTPQAYIKPADAGTADYREIYYRVYFRTQPGWVGGGYKLSRAFVFASPTSFAQAMIAHNWSGGPGQDTVLVLDPASGTDSAGNLKTTTYNDFANLRFLGIRRGTFPIFTVARAGVWRCIEHHVRLNDAGQSNGITEFWIDGVKDAGRSDLNFLGSFNAYAINAVYLENYWNTGSPVAQDRFFDRFVVSTQRIGC